jgi:CheY-like chemotaxis protein
VHPAERPEGLQCASRSPCNTGSVTVDIAPPDGSTRVLVVEDHDDTREMLMLAFRDRGFEAHGVTDGRLAWDRVVALDPDAIVLDLGLPSLDGWKLASLLRTDRRWRFVPLVVLTGQAIPDAVQDAKDAGADAVLLKPCSPMEVVDCVDRFVAARRAMLRASRPPR